jgi:hypothetical protein
MDSLIIYVPSEEMTTFSAQRKKNNGHHKIIQLYHSIALTHAQNITGRQTRTSSLRDFLLGILFTAKLLTLCNVFDGSGTKVNPVFGLKNCIFFNSLSGR